MKYRVVAYTHYGKVYFVAERSKWFGLRWAWAGPHREDFNSAMKDIEQIKEDSKQPLNVLWSS